MRQELQTLFESNLKMYRSLLWKYRTKLPVEDAIQDFRLKLLTAKLPDEIDYPKGYLSYMFTNFVRSELRRVRPRVEREEDIQAFNQAHEHPLRNRGTIFSVVRAENHFIDPHESPDNTILREQQLAIIKSYYPADLWTKVINEEPLTPNERVRKTRLNNYIREQVKKPRIFQRPTASNQVHDSQLQIQAPRLQQAS